MCITIYLLILEGSSRNCSSMNNGTLGLIELYSLNITQFCLIAYFWLVYMRFINADFFAGICWLKLLPAREWG